MTPSRSYTALAAHVVWATEGRSPLLDADGVDGFLVRIVRAKSRELDATTLAVGNADDHVHALFLYSAGLALATIVRRVKGAASHAWNHRGGTNTHELYWQDGYWARSFDPDDCRPLVHYVDHQREHHRHSQVPEVWVRALFG
jgi:REP element-mobilizing transposase RayT